MCNLAACGAEIELAVDVFAARDRVLLSHLEDALRGLPNPKCARSILMAAIEHVAEVDVQTYGWVVQNIAGWALLSGQSEQAIEDAELPAQNGVPVGAPCYSLILERQRH